MPPNVFVAGLTLLLATSVCTAAELGDTCNSQTRLTRNRVCLDGQVSRDFEEGSTCDRRQKLPAGVYCDTTDTGKGELLDCRQESGSFGHVASLMCAGHEGERLRDELHSTYQELLATLKSRKPSADKKTPAMNFAQVRTDLIQSQEAWKKLIKADCAMDEKLVTGGGNMNGAVGMNCYTGHAGSRLARLKALREVIQLLQD